MREIKFRAWDKISKQMIQNVIMFDIQKPGSKGYKLMQYTGLKDKNGKKIYEGDIVKSFGESFMKLLVVQFEMDVAFGYTIREVDIFNKKGYEKSWWPLHNGWNLKIIGNIYENPELLKESE